MASTLSRTLRKVASERMISPALAALHRREAVFTASPMAVYWSARELPMARVHAEPSLSAIKKAIKAGVSVPGGDVQFKQSLTVR